MDTSNPQPRLARWALIFTIVIVTNMFVGYTISLLYKAPKYDDFCQSRQVVPSSATESECVAIGGQWTATPEPANLATPPAQQSGYCDPNFTCNKNFQTAQDAYSRNVFIILVIVGAILAVLSAFVGGGSVLKNSLAWAGALSFLIASIRYWGEAQDIVKVIILGVALAALVYLAVKKFNERIRP